jgi:hypothetical protein
MYSNVIKERNNDFNFIPPFPPLEKVEPNSHFFCNFILHFGRFGSPLRLRPFLKVDYLEKYSKFLAPPFLKVDYLEKYSKFLAPPFLKVDYLEKYSKFLAPPFLKVDVDELLHMRTCEKLRALFKQSFGKYEANWFSL